MYSTGERIIPSLTGNLAITGTVATLEDGMSYGAAFSNITLLAANVAVPIFTPASNINGAILHSSQFMSSNGTLFTNCVVITKNATPASVIDGDVILSSDFGNSGTGAVVCCASLKKPIKIAAGKGLYFIA